MIFLLNVSQVLMQLCILSSVLISKRMKTLFNSGSTYCTFRSHRGPTAMAVD